MLNMYFCEYYYTISMGPWRRRIDVDATELRSTDDSTTSSWRHVPAWLLYTYLESLSIIVQIITVYMLLHNMLLRPYYTRLNSLVDL